MAPDSWASTRSAAPWSDRSRPDASTARSKSDPRLRRSHRGEHTRSSSATTSSSLSPVESWSDGQAAFPWEFRLHQRHVALALTDRQIEMLALAAHGLRDKDIAERTGISVQTAKNHMGNAFEALGVQGRLEAFFALGWLHPPSEVAA